MKNVKCQLFRSILNINVHKCKGIFNDILCNIFFIVFDNVLPTHKREFKILDNLENNLET